jgi:hypothetical protein
VQELAVDSPFRIRPSVAENDASALATDIPALDQDPFSAAFRQSPLKPARLAVVRRASAVVTENVRDRRCTAPR